MDQQRTTPQERRAAQHPGNEIALSPEQLIKRPPSAAPARQRR